MERLTRRAVVLGAVAAAGVPTRTDASSAAAAQRAHSRRKAPRDVGDYVVTQACVKCKYTDCVEICPVDAFYEGPRMLVINPDECIGCAACVGECRAKAIVEGEKASASDIENNRKFAKIWPNITERVRSRKCT